MTTATLHIPSRTMPWRTLLGAVAAIAVGAALLYALTVGFDSASSATTSSPSVTSTQVRSADAVDRAVVTPSTGFSADAIDRAVVAPATGFSADAIDRGLDSSVDTDLYACKAGKPC